MPFLSRLCFAQLFMVFVSTEGRKEGRKDEHCELYIRWSSMKITLNFRKVVKQTIYFELFDSFHQNCTGAFGCYELELILFSEVSVPFMRA